MILVAAAFLTLCALSCALLTACERLFALRVALILCAPPMAFVVWLAAQPSTGWPAHAKPPARAAFVSGYVREPEPSDPGEIDLELVPPGSLRPRLYRLPYSRQLHEQVEAAMRAAKAGTKLGVRRGGSRGETQVGVYRFYVLPPPELEPKT